VISAGMKDKEILGIWNLMWNHRISRRLKTNRSELFKVDNKAHLSYIVIQTDGGVYVGNTFRQGA